MAILEKVQEYNIKDSTGKELWPFRSEMKEHWIRALT